MSENIDKMLSHGDEGLLEQFQTIDELPESDLRTLTKKAYADLKESHLLYLKLEERKDRIIEALNRDLHELRTRIETQNEKIRKLFFL
jgi:hypothetical protein